MDVSKSERMRIYQKQRYENSPDKHEKDKQRYRDYMLARRQDPEYRRKENEQRKKRRHLKRASVLASSSVTRSATRTRASPKKRVKKEPDVYLTDDSTPMGDIDINLSEPEDDHDDELQEEEKGQENLEIIYDQDIPVVPEESITEAADKSIEVFTVTTPQADMLDKAIQVDDPTPECPCSESMVLMELAAASRELSVFQRKSFESGLRQYLEDFRNSSAQDTFTLLICDKLKRVSDDLRPDLEVSILKVINDTLKADKCKKVPHKK